MLRVAVRAIVLLGALMFMIPGAAWAEEDDKPARVDDQNLAITAADIQAAAATAATSGGPNRCMSESGTLIPCLTSSGYWVGYPHYCYMAEIPEKDLPPRTDKVWLGRKDGVLMQCLQVGPDGTRMPEWKWVWMPSGRQAVDPAVLALEAVERMAIRSARLSTVPNTLEQDPKAMGIVGLNMWMWVESQDEQTWGPVTKSVTAGSVTTTATAKVQKIVWDMGNGDKVTCRTPGENWASWKGPVGQKPSPNCGYKYEREGEYTITATAYWRADWAGAGRTGVLEFTRTSTAHTVVGEVQVVNVHR